MIPYAVLGITMIFFRKLFIFMRKSFFLVLGIPLLLIFLTDHGVAIGNLLRRTYVHVCCYGPHKTRDRNLEIALFVRTHRNSFLHDKVLYTLDSKHQEALRKEMTKEHHHLHGDDGHVPVSLMFFLIFLYMFFGGVLMTISFSYFC